MQYKECDWSKDKNETASGDLDTRQDGGKIKEDSAKDVGKNEINGKKSNLRWRLTLNYGTLLVLVEYIVNGYKHKYKYSG